MHPFRTHTCDDLRPEHVGQTVRLSGWVHRVRDHGGIVFIDLRDHYGITQVVIHPEREFHMDVHHWRAESVVTFTGPVVRRSEDTINTRLATGEVELEAAEMTVHSTAETLPFPVAPIQMSLRFKIQARQPSISPVSPAMMHNSP